MDKITSADVGKQWHDMSAPYGAVRIVSVSSGRVKFIHKSGVGAGTEATMKALDFTKKFKK